MLGTLLRQQGWPFANGRFFQHSPNKAEIYNSRSITCLSINPSYHFYAYFMRILISSVSMATLAKTLPRYQVSGPLPAWTQSARKFISLPNATEHCLLVITYVNKYYFLNCLFTRYIQCTMLL